MSVTIGAIGQNLYQLGFEISPIVLTAGIAANIPGQMLPIVAITEAANFGANLLSGGVANLSGYLAHFWPLPGSTLIDFQIAEYPFANQSVAANAVIAQPLRISLRMDAPAQANGGYAVKLVTFTALQATLMQHGLSGGTYTVATPAYIYTNCLLERLRDASSGQGKQSQVSWQFDFVQPLVTQSQALAAQNALLSQISNQTPISGQPAYSGANVAANPPSAPGIGQGGSNLAGTSVGGYTPGGVPTGDFSITNTPAGGPGTYTP